MNRVLALVWSCAAATAGCHLTRIEPTTPVASDTVSRVARREQLRIIVSGDPGNYTAQRELAAIELALDHRGAALVALEAVERTGGPLGPRWLPEERVTYANLLLARAEIRVHRGATSALDDIKHAESLGGKAPQSLRTAADIATSVALLRSSDRKRRVDGAQRLLRWADAAAVDERTIATAGTDLNLEAASELPASVIREALRKTPDVDALGLYAAWLWDVGARHGAVDAYDHWRQIIADHPAPSSSSTLAVDKRALIVDHADASAAWWQAEVRLPDAAQRPNVEVLPVTPPPLSFNDELPAELRAQLGLDHNSSSADTEAAFADVAAAVYAANRVGRADLVPSLVSIIGWRRRDAARLERAIADLLASEVDATIADAALATLFDVVGDGGRARTWWTTTIDSSEEPRWQLGIALAMARQRDGDAALVHLTAAAASWGDASLPMIAVARALNDAGRFAQAIEAGKAALGVAGPLQRSAARRVIVAASRALGRLDQADDVEAQIPDGERDAAAGNGTCTATPAQARDVASCGAQLLATAPDDAEHRRLRATLLHLAFAHDSSIARPAVAALVVAASNAAK